MNARTRHDLAAEHDEQRRKGVAREASHFHSPRRLGKVVLDRVSVRVQARLACLILALPRAPSSHGLLGVILERDIAELAHDHAKPDRRDDVERAEREAEPCERRRRGEQHLEQGGDGLEKDVHRGRRTRCAGTTRAPDARK
jgi:hypothetical protein